MVVITGSAGGIDPLCKLLAVLPADFPAAVIVVQHLPPMKRYHSKLDAVLQRATRLRVKWAEHGECVCPGVVFVAPQDCHLCIDSSGVLQLVESSKISGFRPAADPLFESVAEHFRARAIAIVLSGTLRDGAEGAWNIARHGGRVLLQDYASSQFFDMPRAARQAAGVDFMFAPAILAHVLVALVMVKGAAEWFKVWRAVPEQFRTRSHGPSIHPFVQDWATATLKA